MQEDPNEELSRKIAQQVAHQLAHMFAQGDIGPAKVWLKTDEAARYLGQSRRTLEDWRNNGTGPTYTRAGARIVRYNIADLDAFLRGGTEGDRGG